MSFGGLNRVFTNTQSLDAQLSLNRINEQMAEVQMRMSTGKRINKAEDDSAGYSIATKLRGRITGLNQALQNVGDAKSVLSIAESSFGTIMDNLIEMKGLATQAANDTLGDEERGFIARQIESLAEDINSIADQTVYQDYELLNGAQGTTGAGVNTGSLSLTFQVGERASDVITADLSAVNVGELFAASTTALGDAATGTGTITATAATAGGQGSITFSNATASDFRSFLDNIDEAITIMAENTNEIGITQSSLSVRQETLSQAISANSSAKSRIMDTDFAKAQSESIRLQILQQTATSALAQANTSPQAVLGFLG